MNIAGELLGEVAFAAIGFLLLVGAIQRWSWLVDPPDEAWPYYSQALLKKILGSADAVRAFTIFTGVSFIAVSVVMLVHTLWQALQ